MSAIKMVRYLKTFNLFMIYLSFNFALCIQCIYISIKLRKFQGAMSIWYFQTWSLFYDIQFTKYFTFITNLERENNRFTKHSTGNWKKVNKTVFLMRAKQQERITSKRFSLFVLALFLLLFLAFFDILRSKRK